MRTQQENDLMNDKDDLQRELEALLRVRPSSALAARVRAEIARGPKPAVRWWQPWPARAWAVGLVAACLALMVMNWGPITPLFRSSQPRATGSSSTAVHSPLPASSSPRRAAAQPRAEASVARAVSAGATGSIEKGATAARPRATRAPLQRSRRAPTPRSEPEVLVAADEARALRALVAGGREESVQIAAIDRPPVEAFSGTAWSVRPMEPIVLTPIRFDPVPRVGGEEGVQQ
jgi:hypothetical protein